MTKLGLRPRSASSPRILAIMGAGILLASVVCIYSCGTDSPPKSRASVQETIRFIGNLTWLGQERLELDPKKPCNVVSTVTSADSPTPETKTYRLSFSDFNPDSIRLEKSGDVAYDNTVYWRTTNAQPTIQVEEIAVIGTTVVKHTKGFETELRLTTNTKGDAEKVREALLHLLLQCNAKADLF